MPKTASDPTSTSLWRGAVAVTVRGVVTLGFFGLAVAAGVTAYGALTARAALSEAPEAAPPTTVRPIALTLVDSVTIERRFAGQFEAPQETVLGFEEPGTIAEVLVREGDVLEAGAVIARLDTRLLDAERTRLAASDAALAAQAELARRTNARQEALLAGGHVSAQRVDETSLLLTQLEASRAEIAAAVAALEVRRDKSVLRAPFAGRVAARALDTGAIVGPGTAVITLLETGPARFRAGLDPALAAGLAPGTRVEISAGAETYPAILGELAPGLDAATRSRIAFFDLPDGAAPPSGAAGEVRLEERVEGNAAKGAWVPVSALRQGPRGTWQLLTVAQGETPVIGTEAAEILHLDADRAFIRGSFTDGTLVLPAGTHRVVPGERVRIAPDMSS
ncbi:MAG: efflux RND transporter periplasmic adaptor subunit [Pseudomonadota bacterium]